MESKIIFEGRLWDIISETRKTYKIRRLMRKNGIDVYIHSELPKAAIVEQLIKIAK